MKRFLLISILTFILSGFAAAQKTPTSSQKFVKLRTQIGKLLQAGYKQQALKVVEGITDEEVLKESEFYSLKAKVYLSVNNFEKADQYFQNAFDFEMISMFTNLSLCGNSYLSQIQNTFMSCDLAFFSYQKLMKINIQRLQEFEKAQAIQYLSSFNLKYSEELDQMFEDILFYRGAAFVQTKKYKEAVESLSLVIKRNPKRLFVYKERAEAYQGLGKNDLAEADEKLARQSIEK